MNNRIKTLFEKKKEGLLSVFFTAGFPQLEDTNVIARSLAESGADIIEIGIPFSDPVADGPTIQDSNKIALDNGMSLRRLLSQVATLREEIDVPLILMGYLNPVLQYGMEKFVADAAAAGVDGLILPDLPLYEFNVHYKTLFAQHDLVHAFLVSPTTTPERIRAVDEATEGFIYAVSASSTTGARNGFSDEQVAYFDRLRKMNLRNPFLIGFGISNSGTFETACTYGAGAIVGSAFIEMLKTSKNKPSDIHHFIANLKNQQ